MSNYNELYHYGIPGMKWGVRRFQNANGSYTPAGARRHSLGISGPTGSSGGSSRSSGGSRRKGIDKRKLARNIAIGVGTAAAIGGAAYGIHRLKKSGKLDELAAKGREVLANRSAKANASVAKGLNDSFASGGKKREGRLSQLASKGREVLAQRSAKANERVAKGLNDSFASGGKKRVGFLAEAKRRGSSALSSAKSAVKSARENAPAYASKAKETFNKYNHDPRVARAAGVAGVAAGAYVGHKANQALYGKDYLKKTPKQRSAALRRKFG